VVIRQYLRPAEAKFKVECREIIARTISSPIKLLGDKEENARWEAVGLVRRLANHGE
jgi:hypothetical protein